LLVVLNTASSSQFFPGCEMLDRSGTRLINLLESRETVLVHAGRKVPPMLIPPVSAKIFIDQKHMRPLDPVITRISPPHDSRDNSTKAPVVFRFNESMKRDTVEPAFITVPPIDGKFSWSSDSQIMTFTPAESWPGNTVITVRLSAKARGAGSSTHLHGEFESRFATRGGF
jgi:hypothetical protein